MHLQVLTQQVAQQKALAVCGVQAVLSGIQLAITASVQNSYLSNVTG